MSLSDAQRDALLSALSDLFLDTEIRPSLPHMAQVVLESQASRDDIEALWRRELVPVLHTNLLLVAGEWGMFDLAWLKGRIASHRRSMLAWLDEVRWVHHLRTWSVRRDYAALWQFVDVLAPLGPEARQLRVRLWRDLIEVYVTRQPMQLVVDRVKAEARLSPRDEFEAVVRPIVEPLFMPSGGDMTAPEALAAFESRWARAAADR